MNDDTKEIFITLDLAKEALDRGEVDEAQKLMLTAGILSYENALKIDPLLAMGMSQAFVIARAIDNNKVLDNLIKAIEKIEKENDNSIS